MIVLPFTSRSTIHFELFSYGAWDVAQEHFFGRWVPSYFDVICWREYPSSVSCFYNYPSHPSTWTPVLSFFSIDLGELTPLSALCWGDFYGFVVSLIIYFYSLFSNYFDSSDSLEFTHIFEFRLRGHFPAGFELSYEFKISYHKN